MATNSPLWAEVQWVVHAVLETGWAQIRSRIVSRCGGCSVDGGSAQTGSTTRTSLRGTCDKKTLRLWQVFYLMHHTWKKKGQIPASNMVWSLKKNKIRQSKAGKVRWLQNAGNNWPHELLYSTFSSEIHTEDIRQLLHEDLSHLQRTNYNLQVLAGQHGGNVTVGRNRQKYKVRLPSFQHLERSDWPP